VRAGSFNSFAGFHFLVIEAPEACRALLSIPSPDPRQLYCG